MEHKKILSIIKAIRESTLEAAIVYTNGQCYGLYLVLKAIYEEAIPFSVNENTHIVTKINGRFYDIYGEVFRFDDIELLTEKDKLEYEAYRMGKTTEYIMKEYRKD